MTNSNTPEQAIGGIPVSAPLFRGATFPQLYAIVADLSTASYHYADDSGREWSKAADMKVKAAAQVNTLRLDFSAIMALHKHTPQLVGFGDFMDAILRDARK